MNKETKTDIGSPNMPTTGLVKRAKLPVIESFDVKNSFTGGGIELVIKHGHQKSYPISPEIARKMGKALLASADFFEKTQ